ncbi:hypothetical protein TNCV_3480991 [Trichonephila clavipes]|nr:hypothetical protein TNCV_3480991 [Trichonephila clavipes]
MSGVGTKRGKGRKWESGAAKRKKEKWKESCIHTQRGFKFRYDEISQSQTEYGSKESFNFSTTFIRIRVSVEFGSYSRCTDY